MKSWMKLSLLLFCLHFCTSLSGQYQRDITNPYKINEPAVGLTYKKVDRYKIPLMTADALYQSFLFNRYERSYFSNTQFSEKTYFKFGQDRYYYEGSHALYLLDNRKSIEVGR